MPVVTSDQCWDFWQRCSESFFVWVFCATDFRSERKFKGRKTCNKQCLIGKVKWQPSSYSQPCLSHSPPPLQPFWATGDQACSCGRLPHLLAWKFLRFWARCHQDLIWGLGSPSHQEPGEETAMWKLHLGLRILVTGWICGIWKSDSLLFQLKAPKTMLLQRLLMR